MNGAGTAGDVRARYDIADPQSLSLIGLLSSGEAGRKGAIVPYKAPNGFVVAVRSSAWL